MKLFVTCNVPLPSDHGLDALVETDNSRKQRKRALAAELKLDARRAKLDKYFSRNPPNGTPLQLLIDAQLHFRARWVEWPDVFDSINRLVTRRVLTVTKEPDKHGIVTYTSTSSDKPRAKRDPKIDALIVQFRREIESTPFSTPDVGTTIHGCQMANYGGWIVRSFLAGRMRSFGTYPFPVAIRLADAITHFFSSRRRGPHKFNTSEAAARQSVLDHPALETFLVGLDFLLWT